MYDPYADFTKHVLLNGLEVHTQYMDRPWVRLDVVVHAGAREDPKGLSGLAHFVEHLVSRNIPHILREEVEDFFRATGGWSEFGVTKYYATQYRFKVSNDMEAFREALRLFGTMLVANRIEKEVEEQRKLILREFKDYCPFPEKYEWKLRSRKALFHGHRLESYVCPLGHPNDFLNAQQSDLQGFYDQYYVPANISLVVAGGISTDQVIRELEESPFGMQKSGARNHVAKPYTELLPPHNRSLTVKASDYVKFVKEEVEYYTTWVFPTSVPMQALVVFDASLEKTLFREIREKRGYSYSFGTRYYNFQDVFEFEVYGRFDSIDATRFSELVINCIESTMKDYSLFEQILASLKQRWYMTDDSVSSLVVGSANDLALRHSILSIHEIVDHLNQVTFEQMQEIGALLSPLRSFTFVTVP